jgi:hypothetical protein
MDNCAPLPVQQDSTQTLSCWRPYLRERLSVLFFGRVWLCVSGSAHPPVWLSAERDCH